MSPKNISKQARIQKGLRHGQSTSFAGGNGLGTYIDDPGAHGPERIVYYNNDFTVIRDLYPKSSVHLLILPRSSALRGLHPIDAFKNNVMLRCLKEEVRKVCDIAAAELRRIYGSCSQLETPRRLAMETGSFIDDDKLPKGRNWHKDIIAGVHAQPSMGHLHVHVLSTDRFSTCLRHRKHYNSFNTPFFIKLDEFPLASNDPRRNPDAQSYLNAELICWRCQTNFGMAFAKLKAHLSEEFEAWKNV